MRLSAIEVLDGWLNTTLPAAPMLNDDQFNVAVLLDCATVSVLPDCTALALPEAKNPFTPVPQLVATQGTGNVLLGKAVPADARWPKRVSVQTSSTLPSVMEKDRPSRARIFRRYLASVTGPWHCGRETVSLKMIRATGTTVAIAPPASQVPRPDSRRKRCGPNQWLNPMPLPRSANP